MTPDFTTRTNRPSWKFSVAQLGCLETGKLEVKPLTLLCGPNNTGKTWVMYALYGFFDHAIHPLTIRLPGIDSAVDELKKEGTLSWDFGSWLHKNGIKFVDSIHKGMQKRLPEIFNAQTTVFNNSRLDWDITPEALTEYAIKNSLDFRLLLGRDKNDSLRMQKPAGEGVLQATLLTEKLPDLWMFFSDAVTQYLLGQQDRRSVFLMPAERNGLHLFFRELSNRRTALLHHATKEKLDLNELFRDVFRSRYAEPIAHYIDWLNVLRDLRKNKNAKYHNFAEQVKGLVGGRYEVDAEGNISFTPKKLKRGGDESPRLDLHLTSSTVKSLFGLWFYLEHQAQPGDVLMIDEPELNLHPTNQRLLARLLAKLVNNGLRIIVSTHSDYFVREINSLIMLSQSHPRRAELMNRFGYEDDQLLMPDKVGAYLFDKLRVEPMEVTTEEGIIAKTFDKVIHELNETSDDIYYTYRDNGREDKGGNVS